MKYIILSLKHGNAKNPCFWRANNAGYTDYPFAAGQYSEEEVKAQLNYYNDGINTLAIPLTDQAMKKLGFKCSYDEKATVLFLQKEKQPNEAT